MVQGPTDVQDRELIFLQFSQNETEEDFSAISYMLFAKYKDMSRRYNRDFVCFQIVNCLCCNKKNMCNSVGIYCYHTYIPYLDFCVCLFQLGQAKVYERL